MTYKVSWDYPTRADFPDGKLPDPNVVPIRLKIEATVDGRPIDFFQNNAPGFPTGAIRDDVLFLDNRAAIESLIDNNIVALVD